MSIWGTDVPLYDRMELGQPHLTCRDGNGYWATRENAADTERGGSVDVATSSMCGMVRLIVDDVSSTAAVYLDPAQVEAIRDCLSAWLAESPVAASSLSVGGETPK